MESKGKMIFDCIVMYRALVAKAGTVVSLEHRSRILWILLHFLQHQFYLFFSLADITGKDPTSQRCRNIFVTCDSRKDVFLVCCPHNDLKQELLLGLQMLMFPSFGRARLLKKITQQI